MSLTGNNARLTLLCAALLLAGPVAAQAPAPDPVVAKVDGKPIHLSELKEAAQSLPENLRALPVQTLYPMLLDQLIDGRALVTEAHKSGIDKEPDVQRQVTAAEDRALQTAVLSKEIGPTVSEDAVRARYDQEIAGKPGEEEVHARHILVDDEATAKKIIGELKGGADFAALAKQYSKDPSGAKQGGDLGFFKQSDMVPEFSKAAFALQPGQASDTPVHTQFGWHVIQVEDRRPGKALSYEQEAPRLAQQMAQKIIGDRMRDLGKAAKVEIFALDGSKLPAAGAAPQQPLKLKPPAGGAAPGAPTLAPGTAPDQLNAK